VAVCGESRRGSLVVLRCVRDELQGCRTLEIPEWMFDAAVCGHMKSTELPHVDCAALLALKHLLWAATGSSERDVVQAHINPAVLEVLMQKLLLSRPRQSELFSQPEEIPELPAEVQQKMTRLLARMLNEHWLHRSSVVSQEVGDE